jgi:hypothetical protein
VSTWRHDQLARLRQVRDGGFAVVLDPEGIVAGQDVLSVLTSVEIVRVDDWWTLRRCYERGARRRPADALPLVIVAAGDLGTQTLPWDIERRSQVVARVSLPGPLEVRRALAELTGEEADRAVAAVARSSDPVEALLNAVAGASPRRGQAALAVQLSVVARLAVRPDLPPDVRSLAREMVEEVSLRSVLGDPPDASGLQAAWEEWVVHGVFSRWHDTFVRIPADVAALFVAGILHPVIGVGRSLPGWAAVGLRSPSAEERIRALIEARPEPWPPVTAVAWTAAAAWWGELRGLAAGRVPAPLAAELDTIWRELDEAFAPWLRANYGPLLSSAAAWPMAVHRVAPFLARRVKERPVERILLLVLDGMGFAQWSRLRERTGLTVVEGGGTFAMLPTYTSVSRQAIFAGQLPLAFGDTLWETRAEPQRWRAFWSGHGFPATGVAYRRVDGRFPQDKIEFGQERFFGVVINAVDEVMHGSELLGDAQVAAVVDTWADTGYLWDLVERATDAGFDVWITADHGNIECHPGGRVAEGVVVEASGKRLRRYPNRVLRDASAAEGIIWDDIPGLPADTDPLLIASGRLAFMSQELAVSHGGLSLDEVVVPLAWVRP